MADDLDAFLRQAAQRRAARKKSAPSSQQPGRSAPRPAAPPPQRRQPLAPEVVEVVEAVVVEPERLETHVDTSNFERRAEQLGETVGQADENLAAHLQAKFDHKLGALDDAPGMPAAVAGPVQDTLARQVARMLKQPDSVRKAILLSEILTPPTDRW